MLVRRCGSPPITLGNISDIGLVASSNNDLISKYIFGISIGIIEVNPALEMVRICDADDNTRQLQVPV